MNIEEELKKEKSDKVFEESFVNDQSSNHSADEAPNFENLMRAANLREDQESQVEESEQPVNFNML